MKRFLLGLSILFSFVSIQAQEIKPIDPSFEDYLPLLKSAGYEVFSFDITSLKDSTYNISFVTKEYVNGALVHDSSKNKNKFSITNRDMISDLPEAQQKRVLANNSAYDAENGILKLAKKITVGFTPAADSLKQYMVTIENMGTFGGSLHLKPIAGPNLNTRYAYDARPFKVDTIEIGGFTPLVLIGSYWYDSKNGFMRFCGENEFPKDLSSKSLKSMPHFYVLGIMVSK